MAKNKETPTAEKMVPPVDKVDIKKGEPKFSTEKQTMIDAMDRALGIVTTAAKAANIVRQTHYNWMNDDPEYKKRIDQINEKVLDFAESKLHELVNKGDTAATLFILKCKGKKRGYIEKTETDVHLTGQRVEIIFDDAK